MPILSIIITILGLSLFEVINSVDNAIVNAEVLSTMKAPARKWFITWGLFISVILVRGLLPFLIVWLTNPSLGILRTFLSVFRNDPAVARSLDESAPYLLLIGGVFMIFVFFHWLFLEEKNVGLPFEGFFSRHGVWFYAAVSFILLIIVWFAVRDNSMLAFSAVVGSTVFFITHGFRQQAELAEKKLLRSNISDMSKILYLEVIDATFSIDGILGSFAFTLYVPLILIGNGLGAVVLREITISHIGTIRKYLFLKNGAMYSILFLGTVMLVDSFGVILPFWLSPLVTFIIVGYFYLKSVNTAETI